MFHYFRGGYIVLIDPIKAPDQDIWQVRFSIAPHELMWFNKNGHLAKSTLKKEVSRDPTTLHPAV
jgi:hypothetical protein